MDLCAYPPEVADDVETAPQPDGDRAAVIAGSPSCGRYVLLRSAEERVFRLLDGSRTVVEIRRAFHEQTEATLPAGSLTTFLAKLDETGILAGVRATRPAPLLPGSEFYLRFSLFNPERVFGRIVAAVPWIWTGTFLVFSSLLIAATALAALAHADQVIAYGNYILREHLAAVILVGLAVGMSHEFAHGLTCKAFGGRSTEIGVLMIFYVLPALYCNVSGIHLIRDRRHRLWVIAAGIYWQLLLGSLALVIWFAIAPHTFIANLAFIVFCASIVDVAFNGNPLIKLDGYYFLSQWLHMPNLMERSRTYWRGRLRSRLFGGTCEDSTPLNRRERAILATFGFLSLGYSVALRVVLLVWVGSWLADTLHLAGLVFTGLLALVYSRRLVVPLASAAARRLTSSTHALRRIIMASSKTVDASPRTMPRWRRLVVPCGMAAFLVGGLGLPWRASVGNYGTLAALPNHEQIVRAPERAMLIDVNVRPGDTVAAGTVLGRLQNPDFDEELVDVRAELSRAVRDEGRLLGELAVRDASIARADAFLRQRQIEVDELAMEERQIQERRGVPERAPMPLVLASLPDAPRQSATAVPPFPPAIAVLQADVDLRYAWLAESASHLERIRKLAAKGLVARSELESTDSKAATLAIDLSAARERLETALVEHRRRRTAMGTDMLLARADSAAERLQVQRLSTELRAARVLLGTLEERRALLERMQSSLHLVARRAGAVFGEELVRSAGRHFERGEEICRIADTRQLLVRIDVPERELADVRVGRPVRVKVPAYAGQVFHGNVARIANEGMREADGRIVYRVEVTVDNDNGLLSPGMTAFARIEFGRQAVVRTLWHKSRQLLRQELWLLP